LAIELAAAQSKLLSPPALLARLAGALNKPLDLLTGVQHLPARQRTLRNAIAWSYGLLNPSEQAVFRHLGVFTGGCTLAALQAVIPQGSYPSSEHWWLQTVQSLVNQSLVNQQPGPEGGPRFTLLEMLRNYALEQLEQLGEREPARRAHAAWFTQFAEMCEEASAKPESDVDALNRMDLEVDNLRTALRWAREYALGLEVRLALAMSSYWTSRRHLQEGRQVLEQLQLRLQATLPGSEPAQMHQYARVVSMLGFVSWLQADTALALTRLEESIALWRHLEVPRELGMALNFLALTLYNQDDYAAAYARAEESVTILRQLGEPWSLAIALNTLGTLTLVQGDARTARTLHEECLNLFRKRGDSWGVSLGLLTLSEDFYAQGDDVRARACLEEALQTYREQDNPWFAAQTLVALGKVVWRQGDRAYATALLEESVQVSRQVGAKRFLSVSLLLLGLAAQEKGDRERARTLFRDSLVLFQEISSNAGIAYALGGLAAIIDWPAQAVKLLGAAAVALETSRMSMDLIERAHYERMLAALRARLDEAAFAAAWAAGQSLTLDQAVSYALAQTGRAARRID
jgi:tetratricopeptide (TPR) repeat protein